MRNPWAMTFDRGGKHELFVADVGQNLFEEVDIITRGGNFGWPKREGFHPFDPKAAFAIPATGADKGVRGEPFVDPIFEYPHPKGPKKDPVALGISITGGYVYRGKAIPSLQGKYIFGDWSRNFGLPQGVLAVATPPADPSSKWTYEPLEVASPEKWTAFICAFGEDDDEEVYVLTNQTSTIVPGRGRVWKIAPAP
jgi:Glucose / Sorbosone dehydrogenase